MLEFFIISLTNVRGTFQHFKLMGVSIEVDHTMVFVHIVLNLFHIDATNGQSIIYTLLDRRIIMPLARIEYFPLSADGPCKISSYCLTHLLEREDKKVVRLLQV